MGGDSSARGGWQVPPPPAPHSAQRPGTRPKAGALEIVTANGETLKLEGEYEEIVGASETVTRRVKEQDKITIPKFPTVNNIKQFHNQVARNLVLASGRTDGAEVKWWNEVMKDGAKFNDFADSGDPRFATLDLKLHCALTQCVRDGNRTLAAKLASMEDEAMTKGMILKGRQLGWLIHDWFRLNPDLKPLYGLQEIADLQWFGDDKIFEFLELWKNIIGNNTITLTERMLAETLVGKMKGKTKVLAEDVAYWHRLPAGNEQKTHEYLINAMQSHLDRQQMELNNAGRRNVILGGRAGLGAPTPSDKKPCYYHNHGGCQNSADKCKFGHVIVPDEEKAKMVKPGRKGSPSPAPAGRGKGKGGGKSGGTGGDASAGAPHYCHFNLKGSCKRGDDCPFPHISKEEIDRVNKAKAKAKPKAKVEPPTKVAQGSPALAPMFVPAATPTMSWQQVAAE